MLTGAAAALPRASLVAIFEVFVASPTRWIPTCVCHGMWWKLACVFGALAAPLLARDFNADEWAARLAHARLDSSGWAQVVQIDNRVSTRDYPRNTWATVFELEGRLWIYLPREGTQSLSRFYGRLESDKEDLRDVLAHVHAGFRSYRVATDDDDAVTLDPRWESGPLPNGCLIDALTRYRQMVDAGSRVLDALLLMYYGGSGLARWGHTVLCFRTAEGWFCWDGKKTARVGEPGTELPGDPLRLARLTVDEAMSNRLVKARALRLG